jgi:hypothetical protein
VIEEDPVLGQLFVPFGQNVVWIFLEAAVELLNCFFFSQKASLWLFKQLRVDSVLSGIEFEHGEQLIHHVCYRSSPQIFGRSSEHNKAHLHKHIFEPLEIQ